MTAEARAPRQPGRRRAAGVAQHARASIPVMARLGAREKIRYAVVGGGPFTQQRLLPAFEHTSNSELAALVTANEQRRAVLARRQGSLAVGGLDELERVLDTSGARAIFLAAPCAQHRTLTERAARAGVHVLCDPPMADSVEDCRAMIDCTRAARVKLMMAYRLHFDEATLDAAALVRAGKLGAPRVFSSLLMRPRRGAGRAPGKLAPAALWELACYPINTARLLFGAEPIRVFASADRGQLEHSEMDATLSAILTFDDERSAQLSVSLTASAVATYRLIGEKGSLRIEPAYTCDEPHEYALTIGDNRVERRFTASNQLAAELSAFSRAIQEDGDAHPDGHEGLADVRVTEALLESRRSGRSVTLPRARPSGL
jgi:predicted dehydrogenase